MGAILRIARPEGRATRQMRAIGPRRVWRALPGDLLGFAVLVGCRVERRPRRVAVLDGERRLMCVASVVQDPRLGRFLDAVPLQPRAVTLGRYVLARDPLDESTVRHELEHVRQWSALGPLFLPGYLAASLGAVLRGGHRYRDNRFERAARAREAAFPVEEATEASFDLPG